MGNPDTTKIPDIVLAQQKSEANINEYKILYKEHLMHVKDRATALDQLYRLCVRFQSTVPRTPLTSDPSASRLESEARNILRKHFGDPILVLYDKKISKPPIKPKLDNPERKIWITLLDGLSQSFEVLAETFKQEWSYKTNFLVFLTNCLLHYGLHPDILRRNPEVYERYNLAVGHYFRSPRKRQTDYRLLLSSATLEKDFLAPYQKQLPIAVSGKLIPFGSIFQIRITSTLLLDDEIGLFAAKNGFRWDDAVKDKASFVSYCQDETEEWHRNPFLLNEGQARFRNGNIYYVDPRRIEELKNIQSTDFDLTKLIRLCEELNDSSASGAAYAPTLLVRAIIDYSPPIFGLKRFSEVANNYSGGTNSFRRAMLSLHNSLRNIADNNIHSQARAKEVYPTKVQSDFSQELDLLLSEIVRILK